MAELIGKWGEISLSEIKRKGFNMDDIEQIVGTYIERVPGTDNFRLKSKYRYNPNARWVNLTKRWGKDADDVLSIVEHNGKSRRFWNVMWN